MSNYTAPDLGKVRTLEEAESDLEPFDKLAEAEKAAKAVVEEQLKGLTAENADERMKIILDATAKFMHETGLIDQKKEENNG